MGILEAVILWGRVRAVHKGKKFDRQNVAYKYRYRSRLCRRIAITSGTTGRLGITYRIYESPHLCKHYTKCQTLLIIPILLVNYQASFKTLQLLNNVRSSRLFCSHHGALGDLRHNPRLRHASEEVSQQYVYYKNSYTLTALTIFPS